MKTIEEIKNFILSFYFCPSDAERIMGFLLGKGLIEKGEIVEFNRINVGKKLSILTFDDFYTWFEDNDTRLEDLMNFLQDEQDKAIEKGDDEKAHQMAVFLGFIVEALSLEYEEVEENEN